MSYTLLHTQLLVTDTVYLSKSESVAEQFKHADAPDDCENVPGGHVSQNQDWLSAAYDPGVHRMHVLRPVEFEIDPGRQLEQALSPNSEDVVPYEH